jgi:hypothetical protein
MTLSINKTELNVTGRYTECLYAGCYIFCYAECHGSWCIIFCYAECRYAECRRLLALPTKIELNWKGLPGTNTLFMKIRKLRQ